MTKDRRLAGNFIYYDGKYWLVEHSDNELQGGAFFAVPIYFNEEQEAEVRHGGANWCYKANGAFLRNPTKDVIVEAYQSHLKHLEWCKEMQKDYRSDLERINAEIDFYTKLSNEVPQ